MNRATKNDGWVRNPDGTPGFTCSIVTGCTMDHPYCFARKLANGRLRKRYLANTRLAKGARGGVAWLTVKDQLIAEERAGDYADPFYPRFWPERLVELDHFLARRETPAGVFLNIMGDGFGDLVPENWIVPQLDVIRRHPRHWFYLLTSRPQNLVRWSPFPENCKVGATATYGEEAWAASSWLSHVRAKVKFISFEPLVGPIHSSDEIYNLTRAVVSGLDWIIIGAMTGAKKDIAVLHIKYPRLIPMRWDKGWTLQPDIDWVEEIARAADQTGVPVYLKDNLKPVVELYSRFPNLAIQSRQEMPAERRP